MKIRHSTEQDIPRMMEIFAYARKFMAEHDNPTQWGPSKWPPEEMIREDIRKEKSYVCENDEGRIIGTFFFDYGEALEPTYATIDGGDWIAKGPYGVVHRIAGDGSEKGIGAFCINWAFEQCRHLRVDTHEDNFVMRNLLTKLGFEYCGIIYVLKDNSPRMAFEKI